ncbi:unnamed protein product [Dovyalis caffra]|uniref:Uncharacterized protein n=1 Tax=Dovyalis caffra TaxID=77055 RepID=A0AAV1SMI5_9ROSI|nr:unnamed protein product [Dovyalis caffra]
MNTTMDQEDEDDYVAADVRWIDDGRLYMSNIGETSEDAMITIANERIRQYAPCIEANSDQNNEVELEETLKIGVALRVVDKTTNLEFSITKQIVMEDKEQKEAF